MIHRVLTQLGRSGRLVAAGLMPALLAGCSLLPPGMGGGAEKIKPADLAPNPALLGVRAAWTSRVGEVSLPLAVSVMDNRITLASGDGTVTSLDAATGRELWRASAGTALAAGVGSDGDVTAVVTRSNELVAFSGGKERWRQKLGAGTFTAPLVAGRRVFILTADRAVSAFDGESGRKLWTQQRPGEPLVLRQAGVLLAVRDTLVAGLSGRLVGLNPLNGVVRWEAPLASPRGINDVERLVDLVASVDRVGDTVCARAFQANVGCVNTARGAVIWTKPANGAVGVNGDDQMVFGTESDGKVVAWRFSNGERAWTSDQLLRRGLTAPLALGRSVVVGDSTGLVHFMSREDGKALTRVATDGSAIVAAPVMAGNTLVVVTRAGGVFGFVPE